MGKVRDGILDKGSMVKHPKIISLILGVAAEPTAWFRSWVSLSHPEQWAQVKVRNPGLRRRQENFDGKDTIVLALLPLLVLSVNN